VVFLLTLILQIFLASEMKLPLLAPLTVLAGIWGAEPMGLTVD